MLTTVAKLNTLTLKLSAILAPLGAMIGSVSLSVLRPPRSSSRGVLGGVRSISMSNLVAALPSEINARGRIVDIEAKDVVIILLDGANDDVQ